MNIYLCTFKEEILLESSSNIYLGFDFLVFLVAYFFYLIFSTGDFLEFLVSLLVPPI